LDHLSRGRVGWNIVSSFLPSAARNLVDGSELPDHDERYVKTEEYLKVVAELMLSSWRDDALVNDAEREVWIETDRLRTIDFQGKYYTVPGPGLTEPTNQRLPYLLQAGSSSKGKLFAAKYAETVFLTAISPEALANQVQSIKTIAKETIGRDPNSIKFVTLVTAIIGKTHEEAVAKYEETKAIVDLEAAQALFGGWTGVDLSEYDWDEELTYVESNNVRSFLDNLIKNSPPGTKFTRRTVAERISTGGIGGGLLIGTAEEVADQLERWVEVGEIDGFNFSYAVWPETFEDLFEYLIPELQKRGVAQTEYTVPGGTLRENLNFKAGQTYLTDDHPLHKYRWFKNQTQQQFETQMDELHKTDIPV
jgi:alkanesulfonate monooxygenase